jgi:hypothetical protein
MSLIIMLDLSTNRVNRNAWDDKGGILNIQFSRFRAACDDTYVFVVLRQGIHSRYTTSSLNVVFRKSHQGFTHY